MPSDVSYMPLPSHNGPGGFHRTSSGRNRFTGLIAIGILATLGLLQLTFFSGDVLTDERLAALKSYYPWQKAPPGAPANVEPVANGPAATLSPTTATPLPPATQSTPDVALAHPDENKNFAPLQASKHLGSEAFPAAYFGTPPDWDALYPDGNPHHGIIPARFLSILEKEPVSQRPPKPQDVPHITAEMYQFDHWDPATRGSKTTFEDNERADMQSIGEDWRSPPWNNWRPPLSDLRKTNPPQGPLPKVQFPFANPSRHSGNSVDAAAEELAKKRQRLVRNAFLHAWEGYKKSAWGHDEVKPVSGRSNDNFNGWGATPVDVLDTLLIMDLPQEYDYVRQHAHDIDFHLVGGGRSAYGSSDGRIPVFETAIRYLGGLLSAYDLSGDELMKHRAEELGQLIMPAFETTSAVPMGRIRMQHQSNTHSSSGHPVLAEAGSLLLEFTRLWQVTGNRTYFDRVQRVTDFLDKNITDGRTGALFGTGLDPESYSTNGVVSFGGMADSYYEYLIKEYQLMGGRLKQYGRMYSEAIDSAKQYLMRDIQGVPHATSLYNIGETWGGGRSEPTQKLEHLSSFAGGMLGLGAKLLPERASDLELAMRYSETCYWAYNSSLTGIGPEDLVFTNRAAKKAKRVAADAASALEVGVARGTAAEGADAMQQPEIRSDVSAKSESTSSGMSTAARALADAVKSIVSAKRMDRPWPVGVDSASPSYRNRPETIESVFYMWRITGDPLWRERGWQMFASWVTHSMTDHGFSSLNDVYEVPARKTDSQESYTFAETFKYYYLLFSPPELISLDHYVFTTEAHPLLVPQNGEYTRPGSGPRKFWTPAPPGASADPHLPPPGSGLYSGGEGGAVGGLTHVQKNFVYKSWKLQHQRRSLLEVVEQSQESGTPRPLMEALVAASQADQASQAEVQAAAGSTDVNVVGVIPAILNAEVLQKVLDGLVEADRVAEEVVDEREEEKREAGLVGESLVLLSARAEERADVDRFVAAIADVLKPVTAAPTAETSTAAPAEEVAPAASRDGLEARSPADGVEAREEFFDAAEGQNL